MPRDLPAASAAPAPAVPFPGRLLVLCDAAASTGLGHFVRCTALAGVLAAGGADVHVLLPEDSLPRAAEQATASGWTVARGSWEPAAVAALAGSGGIVVVDSYRVDGLWLTDLHARLTAVGAVLAVVDDQADRPFSADLVLNQNVGAQPLAYPGVGQVLAGPEFALLRPQFAAHREQALDAVAGLPDQPRRVLVLFGGTDASGMATTAARAAARAFPSADVRAVVPSSAGAPPQPERGITYLGHVAAVHEEMLAADLVVSAGGTTVWELCCLARPTAVMAVAGNQQPAYDELRERGAILPAGRVPVRDTDVLAARLAELVAPAGVLRAVAARAAELTDGRGSVRVARALADLAGRTPEGKAR